MPSPGTAIAKGASSRPMPHHLTKGLSDSWGCAFLRSLIAALHIVS